MENLRQDMYGKVQCYKSSSSPAKNREFYEEKQKDNSYLPDEISTDIKNINKDENQPNEAQPVNIMNKHAQNGFSSTFGSETDHSICNSSDSTELPVLIAELDTTKTKNLPLLETNHSLIDNCPPTYDWTLQSPNAVLQAALQIPSLISPKDTRENVHSLFYESVELPTNECQKNVQENELLCNVDKINSSQNTHSSNVSLYDLMKGGRTFEEFIPSRRIHEKSCNSEINSYCDIQVSSDVEPISVDTSYCDEAGFVPYSGIENNLIVSYANHHHYQTEQLNLFDVESVNYENEPHESLSVNQCEVSLGYYFASKMIMNRRRCK